MQSTATAMAGSRVEPLGGPNVAAIAAAVIAAGVWYLTAMYSWRQGALLLVGASAGVVLYHAAFGFTSAWRAAIVSGRGDALRAQMLMLAVTCLLFFPVLARGEILGQPVRGLVAPVGVSVVAGAFLFGVGMQLGGGCASGTLYSAGGGSLRMFVTLAAFIAGSVIGALHMPFWDQTPAYAPISLVARYGVVLALVISGVLFASIAGLSLAIERWRGQAGQPPAPKGFGEPRRSSQEPSASGGGAGRGGSWLRGPWPLVAGALGLAAVNVATLALAGRPWGRHLGVRPLGLEDFGNGWSERGSVALLAIGRPRLGTSGECPPGRHVSHGLRDHAGGSRGGGTCRPVCAVVACSWPLTPGGGRRRLDARLRRPHCVWMQHRGVLQRNCVFKPARLALVPGRFCREHLGTRFRPWFGLSVR